MDVWVTVVADATEHPPPHTIEKRITSWSLRRGTIDLVHRAHILFLARHPEYRLLNDNDQQNIQFTNRYN